MAGMCPQYQDYWCPLRNDCPRDGENAPYCIIAHNAASLTVVTCRQMGKPPPKNAEDFLKREASRLWGVQ
jgi:hypothetical protein